jgi:hypothetical protein
VVKNFLLLLGCGDRLVYQIHVTRDTLVLRNHSDSYV